jgi:hypothetical protein
VTIGATVSVRNEATGATHTWTIVREDPLREKGEISAASAVAQALPNHEEGDTVTAIVPAPELVKPVAQPRPLPKADIAEFRQGEDRDDRAADGYILHQAECPHLQLDRDYTLRTASPRQCCVSLRVLDEQCRRQSGSAPRRCGTCFG